MSNLHGIGVVKALNAFKKYNEVQSVLNSLTSDREYHEKVQKAYNTFKHQTIIDIETFVHLKLKIEISAAFTI